MKFFPDIHSLFVLALSLFTIGATLLAAYSVANVLRLRNVRISWKFGKLFGYPLFSSLFLSAVFLISVYVYLNQLSGYFVIFGCYLWVGCCWFTSSYLASKAYVTDHGIVKNINDPSQTVPWHNVVDYFEKPSAKGSDFIFMYQSYGDDYDESQSQIYRLELFVPDKKVSKLEKIISLKIGKIMTPVSDANFNFKSFE